MMPNAMESTRDALVASLYQERYARSVRLVYGIVGDLATAEDVTQEAFLAVWQNRRRVRDPEALAAYLRKTLVNEARSRLRRRGLERRHLRVLGSEKLIVDDTAERTVLWAAVQSLPFRRRSCVVLRYYAGWTEHEIADAMGTSIGTVKSQTHRGLKALRSLVVADEPPVALTSKERTR
jgi:RNA polymerase sigma-70 factor (sigma-E family)